MDLTNRELCVLSLETTVLPHLQFFCKLDARHIEHEDGDNFAWIRLDAPKDFEDIKEYIGISISVSEDVNPNMVPFTVPTISCSIMSRDWDLLPFTWQTLTEMVDAVNDLK